MNRKQILIIGKTGQVGYELRRTTASLGAVSAVEYPEIDLCRQDSILSVLNHVKPQLIINAAAYTAVDKAESDVQTATLLNEKAPAILAQYAKEHGALLVHYSTDYVFNGTSKIPYVETDTPQPSSVYGKTKSAGDLAIIESQCNYLIFRLCWVYGARGRNFFLTMRKLAETREELRVVNDQFGSPTGARLIAETTALALSQVLQSTSPEQYYGLYHLSASGITNWYEFAQAILDLMPAERKKCQKVSPIGTILYPTPASRPAFSAMDCGKLERTFGLKLPHWQEILSLVNEEALQNQITS